MRKLLLVVLLAAGPALADDIFPPEASQVLTQTGHVFLRYPAASPGSTLSVFAGQKTVFEGPATGTGTLVPLNLSTVYRWTVSQGLAPSPVYHSFRLLTQAVFHFDGVDAAPVAAPSEASPMNAGSSDTLGRPGLPGGNGADVDVDIALSEPPYVNVTISTSTHLRFRFLLDTNTNLSITSRGGKGSEGTAGTNTTRMAAGVAGGYAPSLPGLAGGPGGRGGNGGSITLHLARPEFARYFLLDVTGGAPGHGGKGAAPGATEPVAAPDGEAGRDGVILSR